MLLWLMLGWGLWVLSLCGDGCGLRIWFTFGQHLVHQGLQRLSRQRVASHHMRGARLHPAASHRVMRYNPKPEWVADEVVRLKAHMPDAGCRRIALTFNRIHARRHLVTVSKSYVAMVVRKRRYEVERLRLDWKRRVPRPSPVNHTWGVDLTGKADAYGVAHPIVGIVDHGSRRVLKLCALQDKASITLLRCLLDTIELFGRPRFIRTDNDSVFTSRLFTLGLQWLGIRHQRTDVGCPWQNGRVERFFGTLKQKLNQWRVANLDMLNFALGDFSFWYNCVRPHQHLDGRTPVEAWCGVDPYARVPKHVEVFAAWDGLLTGFYLRR